MRPRILRLPAEALWALEEAVELTEQEDRDWLANQVAAESVAWTAAEQAAHRDALELVLATTSAEHEEPQPVVERWLRAAS